MQYQVQFNHLLTYYTQQDWSYQRIVAQVLTAAKDNGNMN